MSHSVEDFYKKVALMHEKAIALHRERYKKQGTYDKVACEVMIDDIKALALEVQHGLINLDIDFGRLK